MEAPISDLVQIVFMLFTICGLGMVLLSLVVVFLLAPFVKHLYEKEK